MLHLVHRCAADEAGAAAIEYALVASMIAIAIVGVLATLGVNLAHKAADIGDAIGNAGS